MKNRRLLSITGLILFITMILSGCSGKGTGGTSGSGSGTTVISGKVTLSGSVAAGKPVNMKTVFSIPAAKPGSKTYREMSTQLPVENLSKVYFAAGDPSPLANATVELYDADHPEWLYPVSIGVTDSSGNYSLSTMANASRNSGSSYQDGDPIPVGKYTLIAFKNVLGQKPVVAVQTIVTEFEGTVPSVNFEVLDSDASPSVISILGLPKNKDGSQTWGSSTKLHPANAAIQVTFSMPMMREYLSAISIASSDGGTVPSGKWTLSADWMTATYYFDEGQTLTIGKKYTITIYGDNDTGNHPKVVNVYGNTIETTSTCTFTASALDDLSPSVQWNSPTVIEMGALVDVTQSFRVESNEILDVNNLALKGNPSIGVKPGVLFLGRNSKGLYVYEFDLGAPLMLNTSYAVTVTGGKDLAGHTMNVLAGNIRTNGAADTPGIDPLANQETQNLQAAVKAIFGKWVRSLNDRNLAQFQGMMSPEFYMEYDVTQGLDSNSDLNRDGRYSFAEFSRMIAGNAFLQWDYCGTGITGTISPTTGTSISVFPGELPPRADFEFKLNASNTLNSKECAEAAPRENLYATLQYKNGTWKIVRASSGIDNRDKTITSAELLTSYLHQVTNATSQLFSSTSDPLTDGYKFDGIPNTYQKENSENIAIKYKWDAMPGVTTYVLVVIDARRPSVGRAVAFPSSVTSARTDERWGTDLGGTDVGSKFGFNTNMAGGGSTFSYMGGGQYYWEVIGLSTIQSGDVPSKSRSILLQDIKATSFLRSFRIAGSFDELLVQVKPGTNPSASPISYSEVLRGYDLKNSGWATLTLYSPNKIATGNLSINGSQSASYTLNFDTSTGQAETTIALYQGWNEVSVCNNGDDAAVPPKSTLCKSFTILTTGGIPPVIQIWEVIDDSGTTLVGDSAQYFVSPTAQKVTIKGIVTDPDVTQLNLNLWNQNGAYGSAAAPVTSDGSTWSFSFDNFEIYKGENWIRVYGSGGKSYESYIGIYTDTGTAWVPPISVTTVGESTIRGQYPNSSDWDATPGSDYTVTISGKLKIPSNGTYYTWSEGGYSNGTLNVLSDGTFNLNVLLYTGWNYVSLYDSTGAWYGVNINTTAGKPVIKPQVSNVQVTGCTAKIDGTAVLGAMYVNVSGYGLVAGGTSSYGSFSEYQSIQSTGTTDPGNFTVYVPVASGSGAYTYVDIYDKDYKSTNLQLTTTSTCAYVPPSSTFMGVKDDALAPVNSDNTYSGPTDYGYFTAGASKTVTLHGISNRPGLAITAYSETCGNRVTRTANASLTPDGSGNYLWSITMNVYGNFNSGYNYIYLYDGMSSKYIYVISSNTEPLPSPPLAAAPTPGTYSSGQCNDMRYTGVTAKTITISGTTTAPDGKGYYRDALNGNHPFVITGGNFTISGVTVYNGWNYFTITDTNYNYFYLSVETTNGEIKPKFVETTLPSNNATVTGSQEVKGTISDPVGTGYAPKTVYATVYYSGGGTGNPKYYSSDLYEQQTYGYGAIIYNGSTYSFTHNFGTDTSKYSYIEVYAYDNVNGINHGHTIYVNTGSTWSDYYYKPGTKNTIAAFKQRVDDSRRFEWELKTMLRSW